MDLRGGSAEALAALSDRLDGATRSSRAAATLGDELFTVSQLFRGEAGLRRFATDASLPAEAKRGMVQQVLGPRLGDATLELFQVSRLIDGNPDLRSALSDPARSIDDKAALVDSLLDGKVLPATVTLAKQALAGTYRTMTGALAAYREVAAETQGQAVATVQVARPMNKADQRSLAKTLGEQYATTVHLNVVVDPEVLGGVRVEIGDDVIDGTIAGRLDDARRRLAG
jgi:F-type H+-transporting ATPase subunit delta